MLIGNRYALVVLALIGFSVLGCRSASAQVFVYTSQTSYQAASFTDDTIQFDGLTPTPSSATLYGNPGLLNVGGVTFADPNYTLAVIGPTYSGATFDYPGDGTATLYTGGGAAHTILNAALPTNLSASVTAVGTEIGDPVAAASVLVTLTFSDSSTATYLYSAPYAATGLGYLGFVSLGLNITSISFYDQETDTDLNPALALDNFSYGIANPAAVAPEPGSLSLIGLGALALLLMRRRSVLR